MGMQKFNEALLHWIWERRQLAGNLQTTSGKELTIYRPGTSNPSDGPDFINAKISVGRLTWHGDVEIHWKADDWFRHGHHNDSNYKSVILHVIFDSKKRKLHKPHLPAFCMKPFLNRPLSAFFEGFKSNTGLPCSKKLSFISPGALEAQIAKAHRQYFEQKIDELMRFYDAELAPSKAWQKLLIVALFDGLGIVNNRQPMRELARALFTESQNVSSLEMLKKTANEQAFNNKKYHWKRKGSRPANHPEARIEQGCGLLWHVLNTPFKKWFARDILGLFNECVKSINCKPKLGAKRAGILYGVVWLPAIYLLGDLFGSAKLASAAQEAWKQHRTTLPDSVLRPFHQAGVPGFVYRRKLGAVHHLKRYCHERQCHKCEVFKSAISA